MIKGNFNRAKVSLYDYISIQIDFVSFVEYTLLSLSERNI